MSILTDRACKTCEVVKPLSEYPRGVSQYACKSCVAERVKNNRKNMDAEYKRAQNKKHDIWKRYRLRPEQYAELMAGGCAVCGTHEDLCVDHDHSCCPGSRTCGQCVRGALCKKHNRGEACFDDLDEIMNLLAYRMKYARKEENTNVTTN